MSQLAFNYKGQRFAPPSEAAYWQVRRMRESQRGQLDIVRDPSGRPLIVPIDIDMGAFRAAVGDRPGRYRLDALDSGELPLPDADAAYVNVPGATHDGAGPDGDGGDPEVVRPVAVGVRNASGAVATVTAPFGTWPALPMPVAMSGTEYLLAEALRGQSQMFQALTAALANQGAATAGGASQMMGAAVELIRAADGAGMSRRVPPPPMPAPPCAPVPPVAPLPPNPEARNGAPSEAHDDDTAYDDQAGGEDEPDDDQAGDEDDQGHAGDGDADVMSRLMLLADKVQGALAPVADVARLVVGGFGGGGLRNAAAGDADAPESADDGDAEPQTVAPAAPVVPTHLRTSHMLAIGYELPPALGSRFRRIVMAMEPAERQALTEHLCALPLEEAVADVAAKLASIPGPRRARGTGPIAAPAPVVVVEPVPFVVAAPPFEEVELGEDRGADARDPAGEVNTDREAAALDTCRGGSVEVDPQSAEDAGRVAEPTTGSAPPVAATAAPPLVAESGALAQRPTGATTRPAVDPQAQMLQIARHLTMPEILRAQRLAAGLSETARAAWLTKLSNMTPKQAARVVRAELAKQ